ncbi:unnamed protein product [Cylicocyclus nassatus]|uniref:Uncharacterized protein n=1 Tax=Cylicocyclus nassatus TaxID=53992 RepID=A0AA36GDW2_CYLNA|nr:unnamed protein product [Cylicocyclus nassatus]
MSSIDITQDTSYMDDTQEQTITEESFQSEDCSHCQQFSPRKTIAQLRTKLSDILCKFEEQQQKIRQLKWENAKFQEEITVSAFAEESAEECISHCGDDLNNELDILNTIMETFVDDAIWLKALTGDKKNVVLKMAKEEIDKVHLAVQALENVFLEKQRMLRAYSEQNEKLKERLLIFHNKKCEESSGGDQQSPATRIPQRTTYNSNKTSIIVDSFSLLLEDGNLLTIKFNEAGDLPNFMFCVEEKQQYSLRIDLVVNKNLKELRYVHHFKKLRMRWLNKEFSLGPLAPKNDVQSIALPFETAPQGLLRRGKYKVKSKLLGENGFEYAKWSWILKIVKSTSSKKALVLC